MSAKYGKSFSRREFLKAAASLGAGALFVGGHIPEALAARVRQAGPVTIQYRALPWNASTDRRIERQIAFQSVIDSFRLKFPNVTFIEVIGADDPVAVSQDIANKTVDAAWVNHSVYADYVRAGYLVDMAPYLPEGEADKYFDWIINALTSVDGTLRGLWHNTDTPLFFYNTEKIATPPTTWGELLEIARQVAADEPGKYGTTYPLRNWTQLNEGMFVALGGSVIDAEGNVVIFEEANRAILADMTAFYQTLIQENLMPTGAIGYDHNSQMPEVFAGNVYSFAGNNNMHIRALAPTLPAEEYAKWAAAKLPHPDAAPSGRYLAGGWCIVPVATGDPDREAAAAAWTLHATDFAANRDTNKAGGWVPTRPEVIEQDPFYANDPFMTVTLDALNTGGYVVPFWPIYGIVQNAVNVAVQAAASGQQTIDEALDAAQAEVEREVAARS